jgi:hypothetical protein
MTWDTFLVVTPEIRYDPEAVTFTVDGAQGIPISRDDAVVAPLDVVRDVEVAGFERALTEYEDKDGATTGYVFLCDVPVERFDPDMSNRDVALTFLGGQLSAQAAQDIGDDVPVMDAQKLLAPLLARHDAEHDGSYTDDQGGHYFEVHSLRLRGEARTVGQLAELGVEAQALLDAVQNQGELTAATARDLLAAGRAAVLLGQPENLWIDAKREPHALSNECEKWEFAKDVAAFANTGRDALIVYGIVTASGVSGGDILGTLRPFPLASYDISAANAVLRERLTPVIPDLTIGVVEIQAGYGYGWVFVPAQPSEARPVMVTGMLSGGRVTGTYVSVPIRVGEDTSHWDASMIHSLVQAGRVALSDRTGSA